MMMLMVMFIMFAMSVSASFQVAYLRRVGHLFQLREAGVAGTLPDEMATKVILMMIAMLVAVLYQVMSILFAGSVAVPLQMEGLRRMARLVLRRKPRAAGPLPAAMTLVAMFIMVAMPAAVPLQEKILRLVGGLVLSHGGGTVEALRGMMMLLTASLLIAKPVVPILSIDGAFIIASHSLAGPVALLASAMLVQRRRHDAVRGVVAVVREVVAWRVRCSSAAASFTTLALAKLLAWVVFPLA